jgi:hypothetical protein
LLDNARLISQLCSLQRRTARGGRDSIDHAPGAHDDLANCVAGLVAHVGSGFDEINLDWIFGPDDMPRSANTRLEMWTYVWSGGGTRPPWSYRKQWSAWPSDRAISRSPGTPGLLWAEGRG